MGHFTPAMALAVGATEAEILVTVRQGGCLEIPGTRFHPEIVCHQWAAGFPGGTIGRHSAVVAVAETVAQKTQTQPVRPATSEELLPEWAYRPSARRQWRLEVV